jgi:FAD-dependent urate hydroxylase
MRILIVGAGMGGMTLAALLERRGVRSVIVERAPNFEHAGYMLSLYCLGSRVLHGLGLYQRFAEVGVEATRYEVHDDHGRLVKAWPFDLLNERFGPIINSTRPELIGVLREGLSETPIRFGTALENLEQTGQEVHVQFSDGSTETFDLVVGADGIGSRVRTILFGEQPWFHTGWGGWVWWAEPSLLPASTFAEYWGAGRLLGAYPTRHRVGVFAGAPLRDAFDQPGAGRRDRLRRRFAGLGELADGMLNALPDDEAEMFFWKLSDVRSAKWVRGRVVLLGDAAAGFLPTAGLGASMAMESAAVLNDELSRTDNRFLEQALALYVKRRKRRVERIQRDSRKLARMMFISWTPLAAVRNFALRFYSLEMLARNIARSFDAPI